MKSNGFRNAIVVPLLVVGTAGFAVTAAAQTAAQEAREAARETKQESREAARETQQEAREASQEAKQEAREAKQESKETSRNAGNAISDSWITLKVHSKFVPEDALDESDIDVDTRAGVVTLTGTVASEAGRTQAVAIAKATDGVKSVNDRLKVVPGADRSAAARQAGRETAGDVRETGRTAKREAGEATGTAGRALSDGWITSSIAAKIVTEDALENSDIDVDVEKGVVTLNGTVGNAAARTRAEAIAKETDGVKSVKNKLKVAAK